MNTASDAQPRLDTVVQAIRITVSDSPDAAFVLDRDGAILMANPVLCTSLGVDESVLLGRRIDVTARSADADRVAGSFSAALGGTASRYRSSGNRTSGEPFVAEITQLPIRIDGEVVAVFGTAVDLTAADQHDAEARQSEDLLRLAGRIARFGGWSVDADTRTVRLSEGARDLLGIAADTPDMGTVAWAMYPNDQRELISTLMEQCLHSGEPFDIVSVMNTDLGQRLSIRTIGEADRSADGRIVGARGAIWDISDAVAAQERERRLEAQLSATLNSISDGIYFVDHEWRITYANPRAIELMRLSEDELLSAPLPELLPDGFEAGFLEAFERATRTGERVVHRFYFSPYERWFEVTAYPSTDGLAVYLRDVTADERALEAARHAREKIEQQAALLDTARDAMIVRDLDNRVQYWNTAASELYGWSAEETIGQRVGDLIYVDTADLDRATEHVLTHGYYAAEMEQRTREGCIVVVDCRWQLLYDEFGAPRSIFAVDTDITDYRREQQAYMRTQRMESLGTLAGGIAHDLNNVLTPILMSVQLLEHDENDPARRELLASMESAVKRGAEMIRQVLSFARGVEGRRIAVDVNRLLDDLVSFSSDVLPRGVVVEVEREAGLSSTAGDPTQLLQVLVNLVTNARDAMSGEGRLRVTAAPLEITDDYSTVSHSAAAGSYIAISVEDDGHGMPADVVEKIFEPFFTTKPPGKGTGLGLATSLAIIRSHGGFVQVYSEPGRGTRFLVGLPVNSAASTSAPVASSSRTPLPRGDGELVLVVDDEETIRRVTSRTLAAHGYRTVLASNGQEAIRIIEHGTEKVDLVLTDMMMPEMDGAATSAYLEEHHPGIPIIAMSGLNSGGGASRVVGMGIARFLAKPYTTSVLLTTISETLHELRATEGDAP